MHTLSKIHLSAYETLIEKALAELTENDVPTRIWKKDHTVWKPDPEEIVNRLGWLDSPAAMQDEVGRFDALRETLLDEGYTDVLLLGMGGSSLAPDVFSRVFGPVVDDGLQLAVLDSTDPGAVQAHAARLNLERTLFIVATKSGSTAETLSFFKYFYARTVETLGEEGAGAHFVGITDPGSKLETLGNDLNFRTLFLNDPELGGRYSVLSYFGLVPAALVGLDVARLLERALDMRAACGPDAPVEENPAVYLGVVMGELAKAGRDKLTLFLSPPVAPFADWVEQLIAESTGKSGTGILPVVGEPPPPPDVYGEDRLFVQISLPDEEPIDERLEVLAIQGHPVVRISLEDRYDLGAQFFLWELATAVAGARLGIHPFNQPNVEAAKVQARRFIQAYEELGELPAAETAPLTEDALREFLAQARPGDYISVQAYVQPMPETDAALQILRSRLLKATHLATTVGYGPRFLHSTGQLHKGDAGNGLFIQLTSQPEEKLPIPDAPGSSSSALSFGVLKLAQARGDYAALQEVDRRVIHFDLGTDVLENLGVLLNFV